MNRFFAMIEGGKAVLDKADEHHLLSVLRAKEGEEVEIVSEGALFLGRIERCAPLSIAIERPLGGDSELNSDLYLAFALLKNGHDELVLQKGTELGVKGFLPFVSKRTIIDLKEKDKEKRLLRYQKIVKGAAEQSKRLFIPTVSTISSFKSVLSFESDRKFFAYEGAASDKFDLLARLSGIKKGSKTIVLIGPEGGFAPEEALLAKEKGFETISLGRRILRAETASICFASAFMATDEERL